MPFRPILGKAKSFKSQVGAVLGALVIAVLIVVEATNGIVFYDLISKSQKIQMDNFRQSTIRQLQMQDWAFLIIEEQAEKALRNWMTAFQTQYEEAEGNPGQIDFTQLKASAGNNVEFFIIDSEDVVRYTTFPPDQGLDFRKFPLMETFIRQVWNTDEVITARATSGVNGGVKKFIYQRTRDQKHILELGISLYTEQYFANFGIDQWKEGLANNTGIVASVNVYNYNGHSFASKNYSAIEGPQRIAFDKAIETGERQTYIQDNLVYEYNIVPRSGSKDALFAGMVAEMVYDNSKWTNIWYKQILLQSIIGLFVIILFGFTSRYLARMVARPVNAISEHVKRIATGDLSVPVQIDAGAEIRQLAENIDFMRSSMLESKGQLADAYETSLRAFLTALKFREESLAIHSLEVNHIAIEIAKEMSLSEDEIRDLNWGTLLHDLGKLAISDNILLKQGPLDPEEFDLIRQHPRIGYEILKDASYFKNAIEISLYHHERYSGGGYPYGLAGEDIPLLARICSVADAFQAMVDDRSYRKGLPVEEAVAEIIRCSGTQFDPVVVQAFLRIDHQRYPDRLKNSEYK